MIASAGPGPAGRSGSPALARARSPASPVWRPGRSRWRPYHRRVSAPGTPFTSRRGPAREGVRARPRLDGWRRWTPPRPSGTCPGSRCSRARGRGGPDAGATSRPTRSRSSTRLGGPTRSPRRGRCSARMEATVDGDGRARRRRAAVRRRARRVPRLRPRAAVRAAALIAGAWTSTCRCSASRSTTGRSPGTGDQARHGSAARAVDGDERRLDRRLGRGARAGRLPRSRSGRPARLGQARATAAFVSRTSRDRPGSRLASRPSGRHRPRRDLPGQPDTPARGPVRRRPVAALPPPADRRPRAVRRLPRPRALARHGAPRALLSASPEPFLSIDADGNVSTDPIKGTRPRGRTRDEDRALARELLASPKDQAENVMIVDVLRNDLGRVCEPGSVRVPRLLRLERTAAVQHLVTTVTGRLPPRSTPSTSSRPRSPVAASPAPRRSGRWS